MASLAVSVRGASKLKRRFGEAFTACVAALRVRGTTVDFQCLEKYEIRAGLKGDVLKYKQNKILINYQIKEINMSKHLNVLTVAMQ